MLKTLLTPLYATSNSSPLVTKSNTKEHINMTKSTILIDEAIKISNLPKKFRIKNIFKIKKLFNFVHPIANANISSNQLR